MSDDTLIIRHARLCDCGKVAGHRGVCRPGRQAPGLEPDDVQRVDAEVEDRFAERRAERYAKRRLQFDDERRMRRAQMSAFDLHREVVQRAATISTVAAAQVGKAAPNSETQRVGPGRQQQLDDDPRWREHVTVVRSRLERMLELLDEAEGLGRVAGTAQMLGVEKDRRVISEGEGLSPAGVVAKLGSDIAGSPETVRRIRKAAGRSMRDGTRIEEAAA